MFNRHDPRTVANAFIQRSLDDDSPITPMEVQKLVFFTHGWMLGIHETPLHYGQWEAWKHGPVLPVVYHNLSYFGANPITETIRFADDPDFNEVEQGMIDFVYRDYRPMGAVRLSGLTHLKGSPWEQVKRKRWGSNVIPNELIQDYFANMARKIEAMRG